MIGIYNIGEKDSHLKILFKDSENIRINLQKYEIENQIIVVNLHLEKQREQIIEVIAEDPRLPIQLKPIEIQKIEKKPENLVES